MDVAGSPLQVAEANQHESGRHVELRHPPLGAVLQGDPFPRPDPDGGRHEDSHGRREGGDLARDLQPHGQVHKDLHERGSWETTDFRTGAAHLGEDEEMNKVFLC